MKKKTFIERFTAFADANKLFGTKNKILLAVSGGVDSAVLCHLLKKSGYDFGIAHCNFQLRGKESDGDELFVSELAKQNSVLYFSKHFNTKAYKEKNKLSLEEAARNLRYAWLEEIRTNFGFTRIATAHHLNDSIETILFHLVKGTGIAGMKGIAAKNKNLVRPLLFATRKEIEAYAKENAIQFRVDSSNASSEYERNKIRNEVIPVLKQINPSLEKTFEKNIRHFTETESIFKESVASKLKKLCRIKNNDTYISVAALKNIPYKVTYLFELLSPLGFNEEQVLQIAGSMHGSGKIFQGDTHRVIIDRKYFIITPNKTEEASCILIQKENRNVHAPQFRLKFEYSVFKKIKLNKSGTIAYLNADLIQFPLTLRTWRAGDYFYPSGLYKKNNMPAKKKVSDLFTDLKFDIRQKENTWILLSGEKIIWVAGIRQDERFKTTPETKHLLKIKMLPNKESIFLLKKYVSNFLLIFSLFLHLRP